MLKYFLCAGEALVESDVNKKKRDEIKTKVYMNAMLHLWSQMFVSEGLKFDAKLRISPLK